MPRASKQQAENHRLAITDASARLMRERGIHGVSVSDLMAAAGLTHGGFYGHFASKERLAAEACCHAFSESAQRWKLRIAAHPDRASALQALTDAYLSTRSRDTPGTSCPATALAGDIAREPPDAALRAAFVTGTGQLIDVLSSLQSSGDTAASRREAMAQFATMVGAVILSRATAGDALSDEILQAARARLAGGAPCDGGPGDAGGCAQTNSIRRDT